MKRVEKNRRSLARLNQAIDEGRGQEVLWDQERSYQNKMMRGKSPQEKERIEQELSRIAGEYKDPL